MSEQKIWLLGNESVGVRKCIPWSEFNIPSFADCDVLIVDMTTLNDTILYYKDIESCQELFDAILARYRGGGIIVCIMKESVSKSNHRGENIDNYFWCPIRFLITKVKPAKTKNIGSFEFKEYMENVGEWDIEINIQSSALRTSYYGLALSPDVISLVTSPNNTYIAGSFSSSALGWSGILHMLPPIKDSHLAIELILKKFGVAISNQKTVPQWSENISLPNLDEIISHIANENNKIETAKQKIKELDKQKKELEQYKELLYTDGIPLEEIVKKSLSLIGISNVRKGRQGNFEDLIFDFTIPECQLCPIEVKGLENNMKLEHVRQALNWALDYEQEDKKAKTVLIANIYRNEDISTSKGKRENFKDFEDFCKKHDVCIIPTTFLFELVKQALGGKKLDVDVFQKSIINTRGVLLKLI